MKINRTYLFLPPTTISSGPRLNLIADLELQPIKAITPINETAAPPCGGRSGAVTQQEAEEEEEAVCHTGSFMREEARDSQPAPASLLFTYIILYCKPGSPNRGLR